MSKKSLKHQLVAAIVMLLVATIALTGVTYAWFSINTTVDVTGMSVTTQVENNLMVAEENLEANYATVLSQPISATVQPVSTINGTNFFYTVDAKATGAKNKPLTGDGAEPFIAYSETSALDNTTARKTNYDPDFQVTYGVTETVTTSNVRYGYVDYTFYLKAINAKSSATDLVMSTCNLLYDGAPLTDKAWRVAMFVADSAANTTTNELGTLKTILTPSGATNFTSGQAVSSTTALGAVTYNQDAIVASVPAATTAYYKVTIRFWQEGEDTTCNNETFASLTESYSLSTRFSIASDAVAVSSIGSVVE